MPDDGGGNLIPQHDCVTDDDNQSPTTTARRCKEPISTAITESTVAMSATSPNECSAADALVSGGRSFDAEGANLRRERDARPGIMPSPSVGPVVRFGVQRRPPQVLGGFIMFIAVLDQPLDQSRQAARTIYNGTLGSEFGQKFHPANDTFPPTAIAA
jgi:hypothetical protein